MNNLKRNPVRRTFSMNEIIKKNTDKTRIFGKTRNSLRSNIKLFNKKLPEIEEANFLLATNLNFKDRINLISLKNLYDSIKKNKALPIHLLEWVEEYDADDFLELFNNKDLLYKLNYKISNFFFRNFQNINAQLPSLLIELKTILEEEEKDINEYKRILLICFETSKKLITSYPKLISLDNYFKITRQEPPPENIFLYRGFYKGQNLEILDDVNRQISTSIFPLVTINAILSTSIKLSVAYKFSSNEGGTIWRIIVNKSKYENFKYSYLSSNIVIKNDNISPDSPENEFILNYGIKLIHLETKEINDNGKKFTLQTFAFADYDVYQSDSNYIKFLTHISDYIESIRDY
jgi:hypothetical protein